METAADRPALLTPLTLRGVTLPNRLAVAPMCQCSVTDGLVGDHHLVHIGRFALGGSGLVVVEATGVTPEGRISPGGVGLWDDAQVPPMGEGWPEPHELTVPELGEVPAAFAGPVPGPAPSLRRVEGTGSSCCSTSSSPRSPSAARTAAAGTRCT